MSDRIDATEEQIAQAFDALRQQLHVLPITLDFLTDKLNAAAGSLIERNKATGSKEIRLAEWLQLAQYRDELCEDLRAAMRWALEVNTELPNCAKLANALQSVSGAAADYKQFVFEAQVELDRVRVMFEREAEKGKAEAVFLATNELRHRFTSTDGESISKRRLQQILLPELSDHEKRQIGKSGTWMVELEAAKRVMAATQWRYREEK